MFWVHHVFRVKLVDYDDIDRSEQTDTSSDNAKDFVHRQSH